MVNDLIARLQLAPAERSRPNLIPPVQAPQPNSSWAIERVLETIALRWESSSRRLRSTRLLLIALERFEGASWQARWEDAERRSPQQHWLARLDDPYAECTLEQQTSFPPHAFSTLIVLDVIRPSYPDLYSNKVTYDVLRSHRGSQLESHAETLKSLDVPHQTVNRGLQLLSRILAHTGLHEQHVTAEHLQEIVAAAPDQRAANGAGAAWELLRAAGAVASDALTYRQLFRSDQRQNVDQIIEFYNIEPSDIRALFKRYLLQRATSMDFTSLKGLAYELLRNFWTEIHEHHPEQDDLVVSFEQGRTWLAQYRAKGLADQHRTLFAIRAFYNDIAAWATDDPYWAIWAAPCFLTKSDTAGAMKHKRRTQARIHQRIRQLAPSSHS